MTRDPLKKFEMTEVDGVGWLVTRKHHQRQHILVTLLLCIVFVLMMAWGMAVAQQEQAQRDYAVWLNYCAGHVMNWEYCYTDLRQAYNQPQGEIGTAASTSQQ